MGVELVGRIEAPTTIAIGRGIRELEGIEPTYGAARWRKRKGIALVRFPDGSMCRAEVHWYEAHGIGRRELEVKRVLGERR